jgi:hypothetical protein
VSTTGGDTAYRMQTLRYRPVEIGLDEGVPLTTLVRLFVWAFVASFLVSVVFTVLFAIVYLFSNSGPLDTGVPGSDLLLIGSVLSFVAFWLVLLGARIDEPIAEWKTLIQDRFAAADSAYAAIYATLRGRGIPVDASAERVRSDVLGREVVNNRLVITERAYAVFVTVFPYGTSLYAGWTMWRRRRGVTILGYFLKDLVGGFAGRSGAINQMLRTERVRAMREAVHAAVREGVEAAVQGIDVPLTTAFGQDLPVHDLTLAPGRSPVPPASSSGPGGPGSWGGDPAAWGATTGAPNPWASPAPGPQAAPHPTAPLAAPASQTPNPAPPTSAPQTAQSSSLPASAPPASAPPASTPPASTPPASAPPASAPPASAAEPVQGRPTSPAPAQPGPPAADGSEPTARDEPSGS